MKQQKDVIPPSTPQDSLPIPLQAQFVTITEEEAGQRIDNYLLRVCKGVPKSHVYRILRSGEVRVNKGRIDQLYRLVQGDVVRIPPVRIAEKADTTHVPAAEFKIIFEDAHLLVIDKPAGVAVHGGSGVSFGVIEQLRASRRVRRPNSWNWCTGWTATPPDCCCWPRNVRP
jgi:23S rRNA pseudouridine955/2504/2580 synthase